jgi:hypothetical protein
MTSTQNNSECNLGFLAEVSLIKYLDLQQPLNFTSYRLPPNLDLEIGKKLSYRLARYFPNSAVIWHEERFHLLSHLGKEIPNLDRWNDALGDVRQQLGTESSFGKLSQIKSSQPTAKIIALLAREILNVDPPFSTKKIPSDRKVKIFRRAIVGDEIFRYNNRVSSLKYYQSQSHYFCR